MAADFAPSTPVEFHWYSGEEAGLLGSQAIAQSYKRAGKSVKAFLELDMTAYFAPGSKEVIALEADYQDSGVTSFLKALIDTYSTLDYAMDTPVSLSWPLPRTRRNADGRGSADTRARTTRAGTSRGTQPACSMRRSLATTTRTSIARATSRL